MVSKKENVLLECWFYLLSFIVAKTFSISYLNRTNLILSPTSFLSTLNNSNTYLTLSSDTSCKTCFFLQAVKEYLELGMFSFSSTSHLHSAWIALALACTSEGVWALRYPRPLTPSTHLPSHPFQRNHRYCKTMASFCVVWFIKQLEGFYVSIDCWCLLFH